MASHQLVSVCTRFALQKTSTTLRSRQRELSRARWLATSDGFPQGFPCPSTINRSAREERGEGRTSKGRRSEPSSELSRDHQRGKLTRAEEEENLLHLFPARGEPDRENPAGPRSLASCRQNKFGFFSTSLLATTSSWLLAS